MPNAGSNSARSILEEIMKVSTPEQIDRLSTPADRKALKKRAAKKMRKAGRVNPEEAPRKFPGPGYK
jgi:hypothetical protein